MLGRWRAAAAVAALFALTGLVGGAVFLAAREDATPPTTTTIAPTPTTTTTVPVSVVAEAIADELGDALPVAVTRVEARCIADALVETVEPPRLEDLADVADPLSRLTPPERGRLVRGVVGCVSPEHAALILGSPTTTAPPVALPDEDL